MENIKKLINRQNTQKQIAKDTGLSEQTLSNYVNSKTEPPIQTLINLADYFNVSLDYLCDRQWNNQIGYIPEEKKEIVKLVLQLNQQNTLKTFGYVSGLLATQN